MPMPNLWCHRMRTKCSILKEMYGSQDDPTTDRPDPKDLTPNLYSTVVRTHAVPPHSLSRLDNWSPTHYQTSQMNERRLSQTLSENIPKLICSVNLVKSDFTSRIRDAGAEPMIFQAVMFTPRRHACRF